MPGDDALQGRIRPMIDVDRGVFAVLRRARRIWAVASIHGEAARLERLHDALRQRLLVGDRLVYLGNMLGRGPAVRETVDLLLDFRRRLIAHPGVFAFDIAYLRGGQEEMWDKLLQLQFAPNPREVMEWMLAQGVGATLAAYGSTPAEALRQSRGGPMALARWTGTLRRTMQEVPGHLALATAVRRAAVSDDGRLLFVNAGVDPGRPLAAQGDGLWWGGAPAFPLERPFGGFGCVVRGYDPAHGAIETGGFSASIDGGCGFGGPLVAACFAADGTIVEMIEA
jgi:serine/threonine protein phosphatase 1